jgi:RNA polymerase sigma factor (sigma-70 family)
VVHLSDREISTEIVDACRVGDRDAFRALYGSYQDHVYSIALYFFHGDTGIAADITQQVFLKLIVNISQFRGDSEFTTWLYRLVVNVCLDAARRRFPKGYITEWYPKAIQVARPIGSGSNPATGNVSRNVGVHSPRSGEPDSIEWPAVNIEPDAAPKYPFEFESSHYYAARSTDSASLTAAGETEKFLFYRGVGEFQPPIAVENIAGDRLHIRNLAKDALPAAIVFQNTNGRLGCEVANNTR